MGGDTLYVSFLVPVPPTKQILPLKQDYATDTTLKVNADTIFTSPSGTNPVPGKPGVISFSFFWSIPNRIPLHPDDILSIWQKVKPFDFHTCMGAFKGQDVRTMPNEAERGTGGAKGRLLESCKIYVGAMGWRVGGHGIFEEGL